ncbi:hypothetical protein [Gordonia insulae]|uniref:Uncharacterized protein n=1 Tax=Gordonia insulae TaxID=2420509 RepID=A0A3G8JKA2_9ACTN|nr:hypothetical protein [Gordonia insulae]AZG45368.1 hypothetical protein D7316_01964 [Gordonia insulae]
MKVHWIPLGAGSRVVPCCGRAYEAICARRDHRPSAPLVHAALTVEHAGQLWSIEQAPAWGTGSAGPGVVVRGAVGLAWLGRSPLFGYEVRCRPGGTIPDLAQAVAHRVIPTDPTRTARLIALAPEVPAHTWGRDEMGAGDMWNSNSVIAWLLARSGHDVDAAGAPPGSRAPGWQAGLVAAGRPDEGPRPRWQRPQP